MAEVSPTRIEQSPRLPDSAFLHVPVILLTGTFEPFDRDRALAVGCSEIITKPFEARKLVEAVDRLSSTAEAALPTAPSTVEAPTFDVEVTPPPPMDAPGEADLARDEELAQDEMEIEDTAVTADSEWSETGFVAKSSDDSDDVISSEEDFIEETQDGQPDFELSPDDAVAEDELPGLPDVEPPAAEVFSEAPEAAETVAAISFSEMVETTEDEAIADLQPPTRPKIRFHPKPSTRRSSQMKVWGKRSRQPKLNTSTTP